MSVRETRTRSTTAVTGGDDGEHRVPLRVPLRRSSIDTLLAAVLATNLAIGMQAVATLWLMVSITSSSTLVALHQTASAAPVFLLVLVAGALADIVGPRKVVVTALAGTVLTAGVLTAIVVSVGVRSPAVVLIFVFLLGCGLTLTMPAWSASLPRIVDRDEIMPANSLIGLAIAAGAACAPLAAGPLIAAVGPGAVFALEVALLAIAIGLVTWRLPPKATTPWPAERLVDAVRLGLRYTRHTGPIRGLMIRTALFAAIGSAWMSLWPVVAHNRLAVRPTAFGLLFALIGTGAAVGTLAFPWLRRRLRPDRILFAATLIVAVGLGALAVTPSLPFLGLVLLLTALAQSTVNTGLIAVSQAASSAWVSGRAISIYIFHFFSAAAVGSAAWGAAATAFGLRPTLVSASAGMLGVVIVGARYRLGDAEDTNARSADWLSIAPGVPAPNDQDVPVLVLVSYSLLTGREAEFLAGMARIADERRRDGFLHWGLYRDPQEHGRYIESFTAPTWAEHQRQLRRPTQDDIRTWEEVTPLCSHVGIQHFIAPPAWPARSGHQPPRRDRPPGRWKRRGWLNSRT